MEGRKRKGRKGRRRNDRLVSPSRGWMDGKTEEARMAEAASFGQVASPERASRSPLAFGLGPVPRPPAPEGCSAASRVGLPKSRPFYFDPKKARKCQVTSGVRVMLRQRPLSLGECRQFGTGRERNAITHVPRGSRTQPGKNRRRRRQPEAGHLGRVRRH